MNSVCKIQQNSQHSQKRDVSEKGATQEEDNIYLFDLLLLLQRLGQETLLSETLQQ